MSKRKLVFAIMANAVFLSACGGGSSEPTTLATVEAISFPLQSGYKAHIAKIASGSVEKFTISGTCAGSATSSTSSPGTAIFEGASALSVTSTTTINFTNCTPASAAATSTIYYDSNYNVLGHSAIGIEYGKLLTIPTPLPTSVKVGDTGVYGIEIIYSDSTKQTIKGHRNFSYVIEADGTSTSTAIVNLIVKSFDTANQLLFTQQSRYQMAANGTLTALSIDVL